MTSPAAASQSASDHELVAACRRGDRAAFDALVERHQRRVYGLAYRLLGSHDRAADAVQETFLRAYRGMGSFRADASFTTWLYRIAVNVAHDRAVVRDERHEPLERASHVSTAAEPPDEAAARQERAALVRSAVARLPEKQRVTLVLRVYHDLSHEEIARVLGRSLGTVKANLFFAMRNLRRMLHTGGGDDSAPVA